MTPPPMTLSDPGQRAKRHRLACAAIIGACALIAVTSLLAKMLGLGPDGLGLHPLQISAGRFFFAWVTVLGAILLIRPPFAGTAWRLHLARSCLGWLGVSCMFAAAARMPLANATALSFLSPLVTMVAAIFFLGERVGPRRWIAAAISVLGALFLIQPSSEGIDPIALVAVASALFLGLEAILIKRLSAAEPPVRILFINNTIGTVISVTAALVVWQTPSAEGWHFLILLGVAMAAAQALFIQAMKNGEASQVIPLMYSTLVFAAIYDLALFGVVPGALAGLGAVLIVAGALVISLRSR